MKIEALEEAFEGQWFNKATHKSERFMSMARVVMTAEAYMVLWEKLDHNIAAWMNANNKPYDVWANHKTDSRIIYFQSVEDAMLFRLSCP